MRKYINIRGKAYDLSTPRVMGILNITPDSFFKDSRVITEDSIRKQAVNMLNSGAHILDVGAYSSRPGSKHTSEKEELQRLEPALKLLRKEFPDIILSVDTFRSAIADFAIRNFDVDIINDISSGESDKKMYDIIEKYQKPYIIMHMQGSPQNMQDNPSYNDIIPDLLEWFSEKKNKLVNRGINDIIIDPGFGFGKTIKHNYTLLAGINRFKMLDLPILAGLSRKSMIWKVLNTTPEESMTGTIVVNTIALMKGVSIIRVHDVKEAIQTVELIKRISPEA